MGEVASIDRKNALRFPADKSDEQMQLELATSTHVYNIIVMKRLTDLVWPDADLTGMAAEARFLADRVRRGDLSELETPMVAQASLMAQAWSELMSQWADITKTRTKDMHQLERAALLLGQANGLQDRYVRTCIALKSFANRKQRHARAGARKG